MTKIRSECVQQSHRLKLNSDGMPLRAEDKAINETISDEIDEMSSKLGITFECPVCLCKIKKGNLMITKCGHKYCYNCLDYTDVCVICDKDL